METAAKDLLERIEQDALRVLEEVGVRCDSHEVRQIFEETGLAAFDDQTGHLHVMTPLVREALTTLPRRDAYWIPEGSFGVGGSAPFLYDDRTGRLVEPTLEDLARIASIVDQADVVAFMARGVQIKKAEVEVMETLVRHCRKPIYVPAMTEAGIAKAKAIHRKRGGITIQFSLISSPLKLIEPMVAPFLACAREGLPVYVSSMPTAGLSAPYSMSGLLTLSHAEGLFGLALSQLVRPGLVVVHAGLPSIGDPRRNFAPDLGLPAHNTVNLLQERLNKRREIPSIQTACTTSEERPGPRAEEDAVRGFALMKKHGFHQMRHAFGFLKDLLSFSIAKLERHIELCRVTGPDEAPELVIDPYDPEGFEVIKRNGSRPNYAGDEHTRRRVGKAFAQ